MYRMKRYEEADFWARAAGYPQPDRCWEWIGHTAGQSGYGAVRYQGVRYYAHRLAYLLAKGQIPDGYHIDHLCRRVLCVNPAHLEAVLPRVNWERSLNPAVAKSKLDHCQRGHPFDDANTYTTAQGYRCCRVCAAERAKHYRSTWTDEHRQRVLAAMRDNHWRRKRAR